MKWIFIIIGLIGIAGWAISQTVTNTGIDIIVSTNVDNSLRVSWKVDENARTNALSPYTNVQPTLTYKQFLANGYGNASPGVDGAAAQQQDIQLIQQIRFLRQNDPQTYGKVYRIAFGLNN